ncbi:MAG: O-antigen ligase family protein [Chloroflexi bacterium]|nr:O-antigen ligase family protein [Chloroflexota bacterium]
MTALRGWTAGVSPGEWLALVVAVAVFAYVGWDGALWDARLQLLLHLFAIGAVAGVVLLVVRGHPIPRSPIELPILGLLAALALATMGALNVGMSLRAMAAIVAFAAMLPAALIAIRHRPSWVGLVTSVPVLLLSIPTLAVLLARRIEWVLVGAPGIPPLRLPSEGTPFGSVAVPPFVLVPAWILAGLIEHDGLRRAVRTGLVAVGIPLVILSGSRSAWLALTVGGAVTVVPWAWRRRHRLRLPRRLTLRGAAVGIAALIVLAVGAMVVLPRLTAVTSLLYRGALWRDTLTAWGSDPLLGVGPGFMPYARQAAAADFSFPVRQPHSHNLLLGVLGDAGLVGLAAALILVGTLVVVAGPWRSRTSLGRHAAIGLIGLGIGGLFEDLTFLPGFNLLAIGIVAVALTDAGAVAWRPVRLVDGARRVALLTGAGAISVVLLAAMITADAGAIAYRMGTDRARFGDWGGATTWLARSAEIDPWHPANPRALAVAAAAAGRQDQALEAARTATDRNPGDATAWVNRALLCEAAGDTACAAQAAERAAATGRYLAPDLLNAALILDRVGRTNAADEAYRLSLLSQPTTSFVTDWPRPIEIGDGTIPEITDPTWQLNLLIARHASGEPIVPDDYADPAVRALAHASLGDRAEADRWLDRALDQRPEDVRTQDINIVLRDAWGEPIDDAVRVAEAVRGRAFPDRDLEVGVPRTVLDIGSFRAYPLDGFVPSAIRLATRPPFPWPLEELLP